jgi:hypothetical protein
MAITHIPNNTTINFDFDPITLLLNLSGMGLNLQIAGIQLCFSAKSY